MRAIRPLPVLLLALLACGSGAPAGAAPAETAGSSGAATAGGGPVVLELFTSQGCSSCPAADRLLTRLGEDPELLTRVLPLAYHVDYWNHIGWTDPFSSKRWSERQRRYARALGSNRLYTPQLVVDGRSDAVGSKEEEVYRLVRAALERPPAAAVHLQLSAGGDPDALRAEVRARLERPPSPGAPGGLEVLVVLYQKDLTTPVPRGENSGRTLENDYVVRRLERAGKLAGKAGAGLETAVTFALEPDWRRPDLGVVAFVQDPKTLAIHGAARATLEIIQ
jgi:hypothetical protein